MADRLDADLKGGRRQGQQVCAFCQPALADGLGFALAVLLLLALATRPQLGIQFSPARGLGQGHHEVAPGLAHQSLH
jgi:hypothetical protein